MDAADIFRQGLGVIPRPPQIHPFFPRKPLVQHHHYQPQHAHHALRENGVDSDGDGNRIAHTLTACCRCRQRKTRCDPNLPRCLPCERSNSTCEYFDTTKGKKISRNYVVHLQDKVRQLEAELAQYTEDDAEYPRNHEEMVRPGGMVRLNETDETPRYLGPSSGIAMTRLLMEEAKRYTESKRISELIPAVRARRAERMNRMQSIVATGGSVSGMSGRRKSYPMVSAVPAQNLPTRQIVDKLVEVFYQRAQIFTPVLHEKNFLTDLDDVFNGDNDPYKTFVVRMVVAISLQKLDTQYAGLADSYYLSAMQLLEGIIQPKDLKTLQCLVLIGQYSLLTPTRTATYFIIGLATRICQQMGLGEEKTIPSVEDLDPQTLDMRRRLSWIVTTMEFGLAHSMGRPNGFAKGEDLMNVKFFETVDDELITKDGIQPGPPSEKKLVAIHFCKMRLLQAEIRRMLYEKKRNEPKHESHPWFMQMEQKMEEWKNTSPEKPEWCKPWFTGRYHSMVIFLYRPSPQIPNPTSQAALRCFESCAFIINLSSRQVKKAAVDITWVFLLTLFGSLNCLLWTLAYSEVRAVHPRDEVDELVQVAIDLIDQCSVRWTESKSATELYHVFSRACMQSYDVKTETPMGNFYTPPSTANTSSPSASETSATSVSTAATSQPSQQLQSGPVFNTAFGYVFEQGGFGFNPADNFQAGHPTFRSNSIFYNPGTDGYGRRASSFPPEFSQDYMQPKEEQWSDPPDESTPPATTTPHLSSASPPDVNPFSNQTPPMNVPMGNALPTPPESVPPMPHGLPSNPSLSPAPTAPALKSASPGPAMTSLPLGLQSSPAPIAAIKYEQQGFNSPQQPVSIKQEPNMGPPPPLARTFTIPPPPTHHQPSTQQRPLPHATTVTDWYNPPPPLIPAYSAFANNTSGGYWATNDSNNGSGPPPYAGLGLNNGLDSYTLSGRDGPSPGSGPPSHGGLAAMATGPGGDFAALFQANGLHSGGGVNGMQYAFPPARHGSLSQEQQMELMDVLETEGMGEIDSFLSMNMGLGGDLERGGLRW